MLPWVQKTRSRLFPPGFLVRNYMDNPGGTMYLAGYRAGPPFVSDSDECGAVMVTHPPTGAVPAALPPNEDERLAVLRSLCIMDTPSEPAFEN